MQGMQVGRDGRRTPDDIAATPAVLMDDYVLKKTTPQSVRSWGVAGKASQRLSTFLPTITLLPLALLGSKNVRAEDSGDGERTHGLRR